MSQALHIRQLSKTYANGVKALDSIDLEVAEGDFFGLLGPNGAGKSTLIGILSSLVNATSGAAEICGFDLHHRRAEAMACIGLVPQEINFNQFEKPLEIVVNQAGYYGVPRRVALPRAERLLRQMSLWDKHNQPSRTLSGGMKRRLMIARALVNEPRLLILDEPTAGVDIEIRRAMWRQLRDINRAGTTVILTTHYLEEAEQLCRNLAIIDHGRIIAHTDVKTLIKQMDSETFVLDLKTPLAAPPELSGFEIHLTDPATLEVAIPRAASLNELFAVLDARGISVVSLRNKANRLEELFMRLLSENGSEAAL